jgi:hypothetical protein
MGINNPNKTEIRYAGKTYIEENNNNIKLIKVRCCCGNPLVIPLATKVLGLVTDCAHCNKDYPFTAHCQALITSYKDLIKDQTIVSLD